MKLPLLLSQIEFRLEIELRSEIFKYLFNVRFNKGGENKLIFKLQITERKDTNVILDIFLQRNGCLEVLHLRIPICFGNSGLKFGTDLCKI